tara:strand:- start:244 stop:1368 length:1125 start_codon:yes stop_codon:yes gene_type:complete
MMTETIDDDKVKMLAEATGRSESDIRADLADDGVLNESNKESDLVSQLREAAELITTVQQVSKKVADNTVLNGGENKTNVEVETTLEGDIVDRAIDSVERKIQKIKKIAIMLSPLFLLIGGGGAYGLMDFGSDDSVTDEEYEDDYYDPYDCYWDWQWSDGSWIDDETQTINVYHEFYDVNSCDMDVEGEFEIVLVDENEVESTIEFESGAFHHYFLVQHEFSNLAEHIYTVDIMFTSYDGSYWGSPHTPVFNVKYEDEEPEPEPCNGTASFFEVSHTWSDYTNDTANITVEWDADWSCDEEQYIELDFYVINSSGDAVVGKILTQTLNGNEPAKVSYSAGDLLKNETYTVYLSIWVDKDGWRLDAEWQVETRFE